MCGRKNPKNLKHSPLGSTFQKLSAAHFRCHRACADKCFLVGLSCAVERLSNELTARTRTTCPTLSGSKGRICCRHAPFSPKSSVEHDWSPLAAHALPAIAKGLKREVSLSQSADRHALHTEQLLAGQAQTGSCKVRVPGAQSQRRVVAAKGDL